MSGPGVFASKRVLVAGAGVTGPSVVRALLREGASVTVTDADEGRLAKLADSVDGLGVAEPAVGLTEPPAGTDLVVTAPGWKPTAPLLVAAADAGIEVIGDVELAWRLCRRMDEPSAWLVVTGTNGKTTTVGMLESILKAAGLDAIACGNIGLPVLEAIEGGHRVLAVELSSFQLHWAPSVRPVAGALLNIAEDHLDWHGSLEAYAQAKARVLTGDVAIGGVDDPYVAKLLVNSPAARKVGVTLEEPLADQLGVHDGKLVDRAFGDADLVDVDDVRPGGPPGLTDALVAAAVARAYGVTAQAVADGLRAYRPAAHRAAVVAEQGGITYVNDSKATNPHAAAASIRAHDRVVWIAGGLLKGASVDDLVAETAPRLAGVVLIGQDRDVIAAALARHAPDVPVSQVATGDDDAMTRAVDLAGAMAHPGDVVLLAPAAASMDMFTDYGHRGRAFAEAVLTRLGLPT
ncbi:UDP-N-acetylmuramoyl-L-alanine--D-glutamate ligase [Kutzneria kofuensis]|uniref:UDP-N-acetylmuramoylalanine--D-glutamate ligase n=1 Tax=Kutzneria kofuensis TaxID=103725 RepID=A0A7W9KKM1_9PSEU|nr:UDP-N-acetylmuramoyl-L-alanine--D-glutamate ligase [Kutzneria kofuensis]MBB5894301.1 UDP-N-acetylmuramoylalanine--D-glutamate ligase [Kutzneria kofuensis]